MLYLSDAIRGEYVQDEFNVIEAPCGCGKTEYAVNKLPYEILGSKPQFNKVLYLIDTCAGRHSIVAKHPERPAAMITSLITAVGGLMVLMQIELL